MLLAVFEYHVAIVDENDGGSIVHRRVKDFVNFLKEVPRPRNEGAVDEEEFALQAMG